MEIKEVNNREKLQDEIVNVADQLYEIFMFVKEENAGSKQLDFCTDPGVVDKFENVIRRVDMIKKILYQED